MAEREQTPRRSPIVIMTDIVFPSDANSFGTMFGGHAMAMMDKAAVLAAVRFARQSFVTISSDGIQFVTPIRVGDIIETRSRVAWVGHTSLIVRVEMYRESRYSYEPPELATKDLFALAARDITGKPAVLPPLLVETDEEKRDWAIAQAFRDYSKEARK